MMTDINFKNIIARGGSQARAFEELCTQLAIKTLKGTETFERYHGDGGDGGVECVAKSMDGSITGWQSKFVSNINDLIKQASSSLATAIKIHPTLKKFIVCFPFDLTGQTGRTTKKGIPAQSGSEKLNKWIKQAVANYKAQGAVLDEIEVWPANRLTALLLQYDVSAGIQTYFFSEAAITENWFQKNIDISIKKAGPRYNPKLSVTTDLWKSFAAFGQTDDWKIVVNELLDKVRKKLKDFCSNINKQSNDNVFPGFSEKFTDQARTIYESSQKIIGMLSGHLTDKVVTSANEKLEKVIELLGNLERQQVNDLNEENKGEQWDNKRWRSFMSEYMVSFPAACLDLTRETQEMLNELMLFIESRNFQLTSEKVFVLSGIGGSGKTHSICDIAVQRLNCNLLSCIAFGDQFAGNPDEWTRFAEALGLKNLGNDQLLDALNAAAQQSGKPMIIFIDAINETIPRTYWTNRIVAFADEIVRRPYLKLCISCRTSFNLICLSESQFCTIEHTGFKGHEREACNAFFNFYKLNPPLIPVLQPELSNPLYLKLVCSTLQAQGLKDLPTGWTGLLPVIKAFLFEKEKQLCQQNGLSPNGALVVTALTSIIQEIASRSETSLPWSDATTAIAKTNPPISAHNVLDWIVNADLLIEDGSINEQELVSQTYVRPAFERLGDFLLATEIAKQAELTSNESFLSHSMLKEIFKDEGSIHSNISLIAALSVILPENYEVELPLLFKESSLYKQISEIATKSLIWRTPTSLTFSTRIFVQDTLREEGYIVMDALFAISANESWLDALWLSQLFELTNMPERDAFLAGYLYTRYNENGIFKRLIEAYKDLDLRSLNERVAFRWLITLIWLTSSPDRRFKDTSTRAAIAILKSWNKLASKLLAHFLYVDDEEIVERLLLIVYAAQILNPERENLSKLSRELIENYTRKPEEFENALIRDHIRCIAELAEYLGCLPDSVDPLTSNRSSTDESWTLPIPDNAKLSSWKKGNGAIRMASRSALTDDFNHYSISCLNKWSKNMSKDNFGEWIINDVVERKGLNDTLHNAYDLTIARETGGGRSKPAYAERLGKKYQWNALYRLASILHDKVERKRRNSEPDYEKHPFILQEERRIDPTLTQPYFTSQDPLKNWWIAQKPDLDSTESLAPLAWLNHNLDIPPLQDVIAITNFGGQNWVPISGQLSFRTSKRDDEFSSPYRLLSMSIDAYLVKESSLGQLIPKLDGKNLHNDKLPRGGNFSHCYTGEYPWGTSCNTVPDWYLGIGNTFGDTGIEMHNMTNDIVAEWEYDATKEENMYIQVPSKKIFELGDLWWNGKDGYIGKDQKTVFKDPRIETGGHLGMIADFEDLNDRLKKLRYSLIWVMRGEKLLINHDLNGRKLFTQIAWMSANGKMNIGKRMFFENFDSTKGTPEKSIANKRVKK